MCRARRRKQSLPNLAASAQTEHRQERKRRRAQRLPLLCEGFDFNLLNLTFSIFKEIIIFVIIISYYAQSIKEMMF